MLMTMGNDDSEFEALARRYLDLWQDQMAAMAADPSVTEAMAKSVAALSSNMATMMNGAPPFPTPFPFPAPSTDANPLNRDSKEARHADAATNRNAPFPASRAQTAGLASDDQCGDAADLLRRIAELEDRVAQLEKGTRPRRSGTKPGPKRSRT